VVRGKERDKDKNNVLLRKKIHGWELSERIIRVLWERVHTIPNRSPSIGSAFGGGREDEKIVLILPMQAGFCPKQHAI